ncbi:L,D-transpeptidase [Segnochrobactraceae bacterium EtOH-i3]
MTHTLPETTRTALRFGAVVALPLLLAACAGFGTANNQWVPTGSYAAPIQPIASRFPPETIAMYGPITDGEAHPVPGISLRRMNPAFVRQIVPFDSPEPAGTIIVDPNQKFLFYVLGNGEAMRYGVGVGKAGMEWAGTATVNRTAQWPRWTPTPDMIARDPAKNKPWAGGMPGGPDNPLGARALYLYDETGRDTLYRIHGTNEPWTIGSAVSSGCIRMMNQDVIDLYNRVTPGTRVIVVGQG